MINFPIIILLINFLISATYSNIPFSTFINNLDSIKNTLPEKYHKQLDDANFRNDIEDFKKLESIAIKKLNLLEENLLKPKIKAEKKWIQRHTELDELAYKQYVIDGVPPWLAKDWATVSVGNYIPHEYIEHYVLDDNLCKSLVCIDLNLEPNPNEIIDIYGYKHLLTIDEVNWEDFGFSIQLNNLLFKIESESGKFIYDLKLDFNFKDKQNIDFWINKINRELPNFELLNECNTGMKSCSKIYQGNINEIIFPDYLLNPREIDKNNIADLTLVKLILPTKFLNDLEELKKININNENNLNDNINLIINKPNITFSISSFEKEFKEFELINNHYNIYWQEINDILISKYDFIKFKPTFQLEF